MSGKTRVLRNTPWLTFVVLGLIALGSGCTTLGPTPGMTMANMVPQDRMGGEVQVGMAPGFHLSHAVEQDNDWGTVLPQVGGFFDPGDTLGPAKGLGIGMRWVGGSEGQLFEPMLRYRRFVDDSEVLSLGVVAYGTHAVGAEGGARLEVSRGGAELGFDVRATPKNRWVELHFTGGVSVTGIGLKGRYCLDQTTGYGRDCDHENGEVGDTQVEMLSAYPAGFVGLSLDVLRDVPVFHGLKLAAYFAGGTMPRVKFNEREKDQAWFSFGLGLTLGIGDW